MAKKKKAAKADSAPIDDIIMDRMPGADPVEEVKFEVDMNFATPEEEVTFPEGGEVEEAEETETVASGDEADIQESTEEVEAETEVEAEESADSSGEAEGDEAVEQVASTDDRGNEEEVLEPEPIKKKALMVPKTRLDEVLAKNKAMQKQLKIIEQKEAETQAQAPKYNFSEKELEYQRLVLDGDSAKAVELRGEIRNAEREQLMFEVQNQMGKTVQQNQEEQALQKKAAEIQELFPILDQDSTAFNETLTQEVMDLRDAFIMQGYGAADSLARATEYALSARYPELLKGSEAAPSKVTQIKQKKQKTIVKKKIAAANAQPPAMRGEGAGERGEKAVDLNILSDSEFSALPEETIKRLRGDFG